MAEVNQGQITKGPTIDELLEEHLKNLPSEVRQAVIGLDWGGTIQELGKKYDLRVDQMGTLHFETLAATIGLTHPADYYKVVKEKLGLPEEKATALVNDVNLQIWAKIRDKVKELTGDKRTEEEELMEIVKEDSEIADQMIARFNSLPDEVKWVVTDPELPGKIALLAEEYKIDPGSLEDLITIVLMGYLPPDDFVVEVKEKFNLTDDQAIALAKATEESIWKDIKPKLEGMMKKEEAAFKTKEVLEEVGKEKAGVAGLETKEKVTAAAEAKELIKEKLKGKFQLPSIKTTSAPPSKIETPGASPGGKIDPYREKID